MIYIKLLKDFIITTYMYSLCYRKAWH